MDPEGEKQEISKVVKEGQMAVSEIYQERR